MNPSSSPTTLLPLPPLPPFFTAPFPTPLERLPALAKSPPPRQPLPTLTALRCSGADSNRFLHSQLTNDVTSLKPGDVQLTALCNAQGRLLTTFYLLHHTTDVFFLVLASDLAEAITAHLRKYILRSKVVLEACALTALLCPTTPETATGTRPGEQPPGVTELRLPTVAGIERHLLIAAPGLAMNDLATNVEASQQEAFNHLFALLCLAAREPHIHTTTQAQFVPQMLNLDLFNAINFKKGCYPGQEVVARSHYLGKVKRRLFLFYADFTHTATTPTPGTAVMAGEEEAGTVIQQTTGWGFAVLNLSALEGQHPLTVAGQPLQKLFSYETAPQGQ